MKRVKAKNQSLPKINSLTGLKAIAMLLIFWWHAPLKDPSFDAGAQMCQLLFICSGFLIGYQSLKNNNPSEPTWKDSFSYCWKKIKRMWPLHAICAAVCLFLFTVPIFSGETFVRFILNLLLLQAWQPSNTNYFAFNGASWFLSALLFCYFLSPLLCKTIRRGKTRIIIALVTAFIIRLGFEYVINHYPRKIFGISSHVFPPIRVCEFYCGILMVPAYRHIKSKLDSLEKRKRFWLSTIIEILAVSVATLIIYACEDYWLRGAYLLIYLPLVVVLACDSGLISKILSIKPLMVFGKIQFSFYILHQVVIKFFSHYGVLTSQRPSVRTAVIFVIILALALFYDYILSPMATKCISHISVRLNKKKTKSQTRR